MPTENNVMLGVGLGLGLGLGLVRLSKWRHCTVVAVVYVVLQTEEEGEERRGHGRRCLGVLVGGGAVVVGTYLCTYTYTACFVRRVVVA